MYTLSDYGAMLAHRARTEAYAKALGRAVKPDHVVLDLGCGPGLFSLLACRAGARRVYAMELSDSVAFARELVYANGCSGQVELMHGSSLRIELPERVDVIVSDVRGTLPLAGDALAVLEDARCRFLRPQGVMIPAADRLFAALASAPEYYAGLIAPWRDSDGLRLSPLLQRVLNSAHSVSFEAERVMSDPVPWCQIDYRSAGPHRPSAQLELRASRRGAAHGLCIWFEATLFGDIRYCSAPGQPDNIYGQLFLPWSEPVELEAAQRVQVELHADRVRDDYVWRWHSRFRNGTGGREFSQSTLESARFLPKTLERRSAGFVPKLSRAAEAESWVLQSMDGTRSVERIAAEAAARYPSVFRNAQEAFQLVSRLADKFAL